LTQEKADPDQNEQYATLTSHGTIKYTEKIPKVRDGSGDLQITGEWLNFERTPRKPDQ
jgi:hypothetical protein